MHFTTMSRAERERRKAEKIFIKGKACGMLESGKSAAEIASELPVSRRSIERWQSNHFLLFDKPRSGRPRQTDSELDARIVNAALKDPSVTSDELTAEANVSRWTIQRRLKEAGLKSRKRPSTVELSDRHKRTRLTWAMKHCHWNAPQWRRVVWSDEASVRLRGKDGRLRLWVRSDKEIPSELGQLCRQGGGWLLIWGAIWLGGRSELVIQRETMNSERYRQVLENQIYPISFHLGDPSTDWLLMDDNAPPHRSLLIRQFKESSGLRSFEWPPASPDLNPIENVWGMLKKRIRRQLKPSDSLNDLERLLRIEWSQLNQEKIDRLIQSMPRRVKSVIEKCGSNTKY